AAFERDLGEMVKLVKNPKTDLYVKFPHGDGQTILREALVLADHNAYHLGQLVDLRRGIRAWPESLEFAWLSSVFRKRVYWPAPSRRKNWRGILRGEVAPWGFGGRLEGF